jgi:Transposase DDE domain group 1
VECPLWIRSGHSPPISPSSALRQKRTFRPRLHRRVAERRPMTAVMLDMDSRVSPIFGDQENTAYNGHFGCIYYHPLFVFNQFSDLERCALRPGNVPSADGWRDVLEPVVARYRNRKMRRFFRADAAFANREVYEFMEAEGYKYTIRLLANQVLQERTACASVRG